MNCYIEKHNRKALENNNPEEILPFFWDESMGEIQGIFPKKNKKYLKIGGNNRRVFRNFDWTREWIPEKWIELKDNEVVVMSQWDKEIHEAIMKEEAKFESLVTRGVLDRHWHYKEPRCKSDGYIGLFGVGGMHIWCCSRSNGCRKQQGLCRPYQRKRAYEDLVRDYGRLMYKEQRAMSENEMAQFKAELGEGARFEFHFVREKDCPTWKVQRELDFVTNYPDTLVFLIKTA